MIAKDLWHGLGVDRSRWHQRRRVKHRLGESGRHIWRSLLELVVVKLWMLE